MKKKQEGGGVALFGDQKIRRVLVDNEWWFSVVDVCGVLTDSHNPQVYWRVLKKRLVDEGVTETVTKCNGLKNKEYCQPSDFSGQLKDESEFQLSTICRQLKLITNLVLLTTYHI